MTNYYPVRFGPRGFFFASSSVSETSHSYFWMHDDSAHTKIGFLQYRHCRNTTLEPVLDLAVSCSSAFELIVIFLKFSTNIQCRWLIFNDHLWANRITFCFQWTQSHVCGSSLSVPMRFRRHDRRDSFTPQIPKTANTARLQKRFAFVDGFFVRLTITVSQQLISFYCRNTALNFQ